jgi:hypothetical protein
MIKVKKELLESFYEQSVKEMKLEDTQFPYKLFIKLVDEFKDENLELFNTLKDTINAIERDMRENLDISDTDLKIIKLNMIWPALCIYNSIKQQMISNELENV